MKPKTSFDFSLDLLDESVDVGGGGVAGIDNKVAVLEGNLGTTNLFAFPV